MITLDTIAGLRDHLAIRRHAGDRIALVPTMGALHEGHLRLCDIARSTADTVVMSVFVNPLQFGPGEDFARYPRDPGRDARLAASRGVDILFAPPVEEIYPEGEARVRVHAPGLADVLCGKYRLGHFEGVLTVVAKLFHIVCPDTAVFGQKDLQQAALIRRMVRDLDFEIDIRVAPITREPDGLAMSSRNAYLAPADRSAALALHRSLRAAQAAFSAGERDPAMLARIAAAILHQEPGVSVQYVEVVDVDTLVRPAVVAPGNAVAVAGFVGATRLIDNLILE